MATFSWKARHSVLAVIFVAWIVSFVDRIALSVAIPYIGKDLGLDPVEMGLVMSAFFATYTLMQLPGGWLADRFGVRRVATVALIWWSSFTAATGAAGNLGHLLVARAAFGVGEGVFPPCSFKTIAVWFPKNERASASAIMLAANSVGSAIAPLIVVTIIATWGWRSVFYMLFIPGALVAFAFWRVVADEPRLDPQAAASEGSDDLNDRCPTEEPNSQRMRFVDLLTNALYLRYFVALFAFGLAFWGFVTWLPTYLITVRGFSTAQMGLAASLPFATGIAGSLVGGFVSDKYFPGRRHTPIIIAQVAVLAFLYLSYAAESRGALMAYQGLLGFSMTFFFSAFWAAPISVADSADVGIVSGFVNTGGQLAAVIAPLAIGALVSRAGGGFGTTFTVLCGAVAISCLIMMTCPSHGEEVAAAV
jgi:sugar phosphate permease